MTTSSTEAAGQSPGPPDWFERFYVHNFAGLVRIAGRALAAGGLSSRAEDVVEDVFLRALKNGTWPKPEAALSYFRKGVLRQSISELRGHYEALPLEDRTMGSPTDEAGEQVDQFWVIEILNLLPPAEREIMALVYDGFSGPEIATLLGKGQPNVRGTIRNARARLNHLFPPPHHLRKNQRAIGVPGEE